jgi:hypothetical protein
MFEVWPERFEEWYHCRGSGDREVILASLAAGDRRTWKRVSAEQDVDKTV